MTPPKEHTQTRFIFFGTPEFSAITLDELALKGFLPSLIVTAPDKPKGRKLVLTPSEVRVWGEVHGIPVITPVTLKNDEVLQRLRQEDAELFIVAAYGKIIPKAVLDMPSHGVLNIHPSLLPKFRGPSPIESAILSSEGETGVTIMVLDEEVDHGPIVAQRKFITTDWPPRGSMLTIDLAHLGGALLAEILPTWQSDQSATPQDHTKATFTTKITKEDGLVDLGTDRYRYSDSHHAGHGASSAKRDGVNEFAIYKKIRALDGWPGVFFFLERNGKSMRVKITDARFEDDALTILSVIPEGKKEMRYSDFLRGIE